MKKYEFINHTADIGIRVKGENLAELFSNAGYAMFDIIADISRVHPQKATDIKIPGGEIEDILIDWLRELLCRFNTDGWLFKEFNIHKLDKTGLEATCRGEKIDPSKHTLKTEIKAVTYHGVEVIKNNNLWEVQIIFDI
ncbi:archease [Candidatus Aerophobetes bacterium]|nr:archease [Candidatus Aerophobetes bacterium]